MDLIGDSKPTGTLKISILMNRHRRITIGLSDSHKLFVLFDFPCRTGTKEIEQRISKVSEFFDNSGQNVVGQSRIYNVAGRGSIDPSDDRYPYAGP